MKALSIRQPWAWAILHCGKDMENRTWRHPHRGRFLIHAGLSRDAEGDAWLRARGYAPPAELPLGGIVGEARILDCVRESASPWFFGPFGFVLAEAKPLPFRPLRGQLSFFEVPPDRQGRLL